MTNEALVDLFAHRLGTLPHPDGNPTASILGRTDTLPPAQAEVARKAARRLAESLVHLMETEHWTAKPDAEWDALRNQATTVGPHEPINVTCSCGALHCTLTQRVPGSVTMQPMTAKGLAAGITNHLDQCGHVGR